MSSSSNKSYIINLPVFEGPFDLLYHLIKKQEIDIWSVSVAEITEQYLDYLQLMEDFNLEIASEFLVMAATLLRLKSKLLLPRQDDSEEEDADELLSINSSEELIKRILEYRLYKTAVSFLRQREEEQQKIFFRSTNQPKVMHITRQETFVFHENMLELLLKSMEKNLKELKKRTSEPDISLVEEFTLKDRLHFVINKLKEKKEAVYLDTLFDSRKVGEIIITFIAVLELARQKKVSLWQQQNFGPVLIELSEEPDIAADYHEAEVVDKEIQQQWKPGAKKRKTL